MADQLFLFSTVQGYKSHRIIAVGTPFVLSLCEALASWHQGRVQGVRHLEEALVVARSLLDSMDLKVEDADKKFVTGQISKSESTLRKFVNFGFWC